MKFFKMLRGLNACRSAASATLRCLEAALLVCLMLVCLMPQPAKAQYDLFGSTRVVQLDTIAFTNAASAVSFTNTAIDLSHYDGTVLLYLSTTNVFATGAGISCSVYGGNYATNNGFVIGTGQFGGAHLDAGATGGSWLLTNVAIATQAMLSMTNRYSTYTNNLWVTNGVLVPGTITTPTAASAGFASSYLLPAPFTNTATLFTSCAGTNMLVGIDTHQAPRYIQVVWSCPNTTAGSGAVYSPAGVLVGRQKYIW